MEAPTILQVGHRDCATDDQIMQFDLAYEKQILSRRRFRCIVLHVALPFCGLAPCIGVIGMICIVADFRTFHVMLLTSAIMWSTTGSRELEVQRMYRCLLM